MIRNINLQSCDFRVRCLTLKIAPPKYVVKKVSLLGSFRERKAAQLEVKLLQTLRHPNIVAYHDSFQTDSGNLMIVMAYCEGMDVT